MTAIIGIDVPSETPDDFDYIDVEFTVETYTEDDTITIDGQSYGHGPYLEADGELTWSRGKHTKWENEAIAAHIAIQKNWEKIAEELVNLQIEEYAGYEPDYD